ncbi:Isochorismatase-like protein [Morchella snyderi]|nr:Isochorismatase-like protein [Morchella snyderi]
MAQIPTSQPYAWPHDSSLSPLTTALVIIDMQKDFCTPGGYLSSQGYSLTPTTTIIPKIAALLGLARHYSYHIFHTREGHRPDLSDLHARELHRSRNNPSQLGIGDTGPMGRLLIRGEEGHAIIGELQPRFGEPVVDKPGKSAFTYTDFELLLKVAGVRNLVIVGVTTDVCVHSTMREAADRGFECVLVEDACGASVPELHQAAVEMVRTEGGIFGATARCGEVMEAMGVGAGKQRADK